MSSGGKGRSSKSSKGGTDRISGGPSTHSHHQTKADHNHNDKDGIPHKIAPTAEQLRIAQMIDNTHSEKVLQEKINQVMQVTGVSTDDAIVALHDCDNDINAAIDSLLEGEDQGEWRESTKKKKKAPAAKTKEEAESNKENRRVENKERSGSRLRGSGSGPPSRFRGRGTGRGSKEETTEAVGRGTGGRRGRIANGTAPSARGRGGRGRGSSSVGNRTFQKRQQQSQPPGFTETIDTWGAPPDKVENNSADNLQIDTWDEDQSNTTEEWDSEWTGSLDKTTVFSPSTAVPPVNAAVPTAQQDSASLSSGSSQSSNMGGGPVSSVLAGQVSTSTTLPSPLSESVNVLPMGQTPLSSTSVSEPQTYSNSTSNAMSQSHLAALLQKAAPHSTLGLLPPSQMVDGSSLSNSSLTVVEGKSNILTGIGSSVGDSLKTGMLANTGPGLSVVSSAPPQSYSPSSVSISNSMFSSNSVSSLGSSLTSSNVSKVLSLSTQNANLASRSKPPRTRLPHSSKIPSQAVEMPEVAMAALDMQFTGLEFGTETFDFTSADVKPLLGSNLVSVSSVSSREPPSVSAAKDLSALTSTISQPQSLGPQPIPFPTQSAERKPQSSLLSGPQRPSAAAASAQNLADLAKKDTSAGGGPPLGSLVGSSASTHSPYQSSVSSGYGPKTSTFPSPPAHYSQNPTQSFSNTSSTGVNSNNYSGSSTSSSSGNNTSSNNSSNNSVAAAGSTSATNQTGSSGYGSSFSSQVSAGGSGQYQTNYVSVSSHSLAASLNVSKSHAGGLKDSPQSYNDSSASSSALSGSLSTSSGASSGGGGSSGGAGSVSSLSAASLSAATTTAPAQPSKSSVPGKSVNSLGSSVAPGVPQHAVSQHQHQMGQQQLNPHHQSHHHLQQQQQQQPQVAQQQTQQTQQLMAGPSQYVSPQQAALQGALPPPPFYNVQQPTMYSFEDLQVFQQRIPHMAQGGPTSLTGGRDGAITSPPSYSVAEASKFRTDQNSSPVPSTINQQGAAAGATYITAPGSAGMPPFYMYHAGMPPSTFSQYGAPAIIQFPPSNTHTGSTNTQFPGPPKIQYGGTSTYYDNMSQTQDYKSAYGSGSQSQNKSGANSAASASNSASDLSGYKNHLSKVTRAYDKQTFHTATPPPFNLAGSGTSPMAANYTPMFIPTMPAAAAAQHSSTLMHHQLHQDGGSSAGQRSGAAGAQSKAGSKGAYSGSYWAN